MKRTAYKDVDRVEDAVQRAGLARRVVRLPPVEVVKGQALPATSSADLVLV